MKKVFVAAAAVAAVGLMGGSAFAVFPVPAKAGGIKSNLVQHFQPCTAPNDTTTGALALPACHPADPTDDGCSFGPKGQGQIQAGFSGKGVPAPDPNKQDIKIAAKLSGLAAGCIGETLCVFASQTVSSTGCVSADPDGCTILAALTNPFPLTGPACCMVDLKGNCKIKTTVETAAGADLFNGGGITLGFNQIGVRRASAVNSPAPPPGSPSFTAGIFGPGNP